MSNLANFIPRDLSAAELDAVSGGANPLIGVDISNVLNNNDVNVEVDLLNDANVGVAAAVAVLGTAVAATGPQVGRR